MAIPANRLEDQRYLGDAPRKVLHDLLHEDPTPKGCQTFPLVQSGAAVRFEPDSIRQAQAEGYQLCPKCFFGLERRRVSLTKTFVDEPLSRPDQRKGA